MEHDAAIIEVGLNEAVSPAAHPHVPQRPLECAADARRCADAGASIVHWHAVDDAGPHSISADAALYGAALDAIDGCVLGYPSYPVDVPDTVDDRIAHCLTLREQHRMELAPVDVASVNLVVADATGRAIAPLEPAPGFDVIRNSLPFVVAALASYRAAGLVATVAAFDLGSTRAIGCARAGRAPRPAGAVQDLPVGIAAHRSAAECRSPRPPPAPAPDRPRCRVARRPLRDDGPGRGRGARARRARAGRWRAHRHRRQSARLPRRDECAARRPRGALGRRRRPPGRHRRRAAFPVRYDVARETARARRSGRWPSAAARSSRWTRGTEGATAVVVRDGRIAAVGGAELAASHPDAHRVDLAGATLVPGFIDAHNHLSVAALHPCFGDATAVRTVDELHAVVREHAAANPDVDFVRLYGWDETRWGFAVDRHTLDAAVDDRPVVLAHYSLHQCVANSVALDRLGIGASTPDPQAGEIGRGPDGRPNGLLVERAWSEAHARSLAAYADPDRWAEHIGARASAAVARGHHRRARRGVFPRGRSGVPGDGRRGNAAGVGARAPASGGVAAKRARRPSRRSGDRGGQRMVPGRDR